MKRSEVAQLVEDLIDNILIEYEPEEVEEAAENLRTIFNDYLDNTIAMQSDLNRKRVDIE